MNLPNSITVLRIGLVPVFVYLAYGDSRASVLASLVVFAVASLSDIVDGYLARRNQTESSFGEFADPLADKLLVGAALYVLVDTRAFPLWVALVIAVREIGVQVLRTRIVQRGGALPASPAAKAKTVLQLVMVSWWLLPWGSISIVHWIWVAAVLAATLWSGAEYLVGYFRLQEART